MSGHYFQSYYISSHSLSYSRDPFSSTSELMIMILWPIEPSRVADIYIHINLSPSSSLIPMPYPQRGVMNDPTIELSFWVGCDHNFFGINCSEFCEHTDNSSGHYDYGPNGEIICLRGWTKDTRPSTFFVQPKTAWAWE